LALDPGRDDCQAVPNRFGEVTNRGVQLRHLGLSIVHRFDERGWRAALFDGLDESPQALSGPFPLDPGLRKLLGSLVEAPIQLRRQGVRDMADCLGAQQFLLQAGEQKRVRDIRPNGQPVRTRAHAVPGRLGTTVARVPVAAGHRGELAAADAAAHEPAE